MERRKCQFINRKYKSHVFVKLAAIVIATTGFTLSSCTTETKIEPPVVERQEEVDDLGLVVDEVNDFAAIEERLINFVASETIEENQMAQEAPLMQETVTTTPITKDEIDLTNRELELHNKAIIDGAEAGNRDALNDTTGSGLSESAVFPSRTGGGWDPKYKNEPIYMDKFRQTYDDEYGLTIAHQAEQIGKREGKIYGERLVQLGKPYEEIQTIMSPLYSKFNGSFFERNYLFPFNYASKVSYDEFKALQEEAENKE